MDGPSFLTFPKVFKLFLTLGVVLGILALPLNTPTKPKQIYNNLQLHRLYLLDIFLKIVQGKRDQVEKWTSSFKHMPEYKYRNLAILVRSASFA